MLPTYTNSNQISGKLLTNGALIPDLPTYEYSMRMLPRLRNASLIEIASQAKISLPTARQEMQELAGKDFVFWKENEKKWEIRRRKRLSTTLRSLGSPPGITIRSEKHLTRKSGIYALRTCGQPD